MTNLRNSFSAISLLAALLLTAAALTGCGQTGELRLPEPSPTPIVTPSTE